MFVHIVVHTFVATFPLSSLKWAYRNALAHWAWPHLMRFPFVVRVSPLPMTIT